MKNLSRQLRWWCLFGALSLGISAHATAAPAVQETIDTRQEIQIATSYALNPLLRDQDIQVTVRHSKVTLHGTVEERVKKELAQDIALGVPGVSAVDNQLQVFDGYMTPPPVLARSFGESTDDATLSATVKSRLQWTRYADDMAVMVSSRDGRVVLQGTAYPKKSLEMAGMIAASTLGVSDVDNQLQLASKPADQYAGMPAAQGLPDAWVTTKVKSTLRYARNIDSSRVSVTTSQGVVHLSGQLHGQAERALAIQLSKTVRGVQRVTAVDLLP